ncbi:MAG: hypothetical protein FE78DRAFT_26631 [Acidomyces sp. 'richmondensis']|nr:MAG: hypothetical protein FE78DRAFT_26631 [Acidomyces sp. 'richmondensis']
MRTSRISQETQKLAQVLKSNRQVTATRGLDRSTKKSELDGSLSTTAYEESEVKAASSHSPSDIESVTSSLGKRKRGNPPNPTPVIPVSAESTAIRRSTHKKPNFEDEGVPREVTRKARKQPAKRIKGPNGSIAVEPPPNWEKVYEIIRAMRKRVLAPVDTMGCESLADKNASPRDQRLQTLVSLMLSSQTKDTVTAAAVKSLQENLPGGLCLESLLEVEPQMLNQLIEKVGFHNNKTKFIKAVAVILRDEYGGDIPDTIAGLVALPGVGPKMAYLCMSAAWHRDEGIGVDVHVHRITNLFGWHKTSTPEQTRVELESWLPKDKWHDINHLLVGFGQTICLPVGRKCGECDLATEALCPSAVTKRKETNRIEVKIEADDGILAQTEHIEIEKDNAGVKIESQAQTYG